MLVISGQVPVISLFLNIIVIPLMSVDNDERNIYRDYRNAISIGAACFFAGAGGYILDFYNVLCKIVITF